MVITMMNFVSVAYQKSHISSERKEVVSRSQQQGNMNDNRPKCWGISESGVATRDDLECVYCVWARGDLEHASVKPPAT